MQRPIIKKHPPPPRQQTVPLRQGDEEHSDGGGGLEHKNERRKIETVIHPLPTTWDSPCLRGRVSYKRKTNLINGKTQSYPLSCRDAACSVRKQIKRKHQHELLCGRCTRRPYKKSRSPVGTRHAVSEKRAKLTQPMSETGIKRTRHAVSLHSQTKGRPSSPPCLRGELVTNGKLKTITAPADCPPETGGRAKRRGWIKTKSK